MVGGAAYYAGKKVEKGHEQDAMTEQRLQELESQQQYAQAPPPQYAPPAPAPAAPAVDVVGQLEKLAELKSQGILTDAEFEQQKQRLLSSS